MVLRDVSKEVPLLRTTVLTAVPEDMQAQLIRQFGQVSMHLSSVVSNGIVDGSIRPNASAELHHWSPGINVTNAVDAYARPLFEGLFRSKRVTDPTAHLVVR